MDTAKIIRHLNDRQVLVELSSRRLGSDFIVSSFNHVSEVWSEKETFLFLANEDGEITNWLELPGSFRGDHDHGRAISGAGFTLIP